MCVLASTIDDVVGFGTKEHQNCRCDDGWIISLQHSIREPLDFRQTTYIHIIDTWNIHKKYPEYEIHVSLRLSVSCALVFSFCFSRAHITIIFVTLHLSFFLKSQSTPARITYLSLEYFDTYKANRRIIPTAHRVCRLVVPKF